MGEGYSVGLNSASSELMSCFFRGSKRSGIDTQGDSWKYFFSDTTEQWSGKSPWAESFMFSMQNYCRVELSLSSNYLGYSETQNAREHRGPSLDSVVVSMLACQGSNLSKGRNLVQHFCSTCTSPKTIQLQVYWPHVVGRLNGEGEDWPPICRG